MKNRLALFLFLFLAGSCQAQDIPAKAKLIGGPCEGCEAIFEYGDRVLKPAHIHGTILEPGGYYYWIDSWYFKGDPLLRIEEEDEDSAYGGSGIVQLNREHDLRVAWRNIILGKNIACYEDDAGAFETVR